MVSIRYEPESLACNKNQSEVKTCLSIFLVCLFGLLKEIPPFWLEANKATGETTDGKYDQVEVVTLPGSGPPEHTHTQDELFYFLAGNYKMKLGDHVFTASAGDFVRIPAGVSHAWLCIGKNAGKVLLTYIPGGLRGFFEEARELYLAPDLAMGLAIAEKYGMLVTGPPLTEKE